MASTTLNFNTLWWPITQRDHIYFVPYRLIRLEISEMKALVVVIFTVPLTWKGLWLGDNEWSTKTNRKRSKETLGHMQKEVTRVGREKFHYRTYCFPWYMLWHVFTISVVPDSDIILSSVTPCHVKLTQWMMLLSLDQIQTPVGYSFLLVQLPCSPGG